MANTELNAEDLKQQLEALQTAYDALQTDYDDLRAKFAMVGNHLVATAVRNGFEDELKAQTAAALAHADPYQYLAERMRSP